jgi:hypothetical protein
MALLGDALVYVDAIFCNKCNMFAKINTKVSTANVSTARRCVGFMWIALLGDALVLCGCYLL